MQQLNDLIFPTRFARFIGIGGIGFVVDSVSFTLMFYAMDELFIARIFAFWLAATFTWLGNHLYLSAEISTYVLVKMGLLHVNLPFFWAS